MMKVIEGRRGILERIAREIARLRLEATAVGEDFLAFQLGIAEDEARRAAERDEA